MIVLNSYDKKGSWDFLGVKGDGTKQLYCFAITMLCTKLKIENIFSDFFYYT